MQQFFDQFAIQKNALLLVACSGGPDSMALAHVLVKGGYRIALATCDFNLRSESASEVALVCDFANEYDIPFFANSFDTSHIAAKWKRSTQETARILRYEWFEVLRQKYSFDFILTAHHQLDQAETVLWNMIRGSGLSGIAAIRPKREKLLRPLLYISKNQVDAYVHQHEVPHKIDSSNLSDKYTRNNIRLHVVPQINELNAGAVQHVGQLAQTALEAHGLLTYFVDTVKKNESLHKGPLSFYKPTIPQALLNASFFQYFFEKEHLSRDVLMDIAAHIQDNNWQGIFNGEVHFIELKEGHLYWLPKKIAAEADSLQLDWNLEEPLHTCMGKFTVVENREHGGIYLPVSRGMVSKGISLRTFRPGDKIRPKGMHGMQKIKKIFADAKAANLEKRITPIVLLENEIIWAVGHKHSEISSDTGKFIRFEWK